MRQRIGQVLMEAGRLSSADLAQGLAEQRGSGLRLASTLVQMGLITGDEAARGLARQHGLPAALDRHLAGRDTTLAARLSAEVARARGALPVALSRGAEGLNLVVCLRDPSAAVVAELHAMVGMPIIPSVACELVLRRELDDAYPMAPPRSAAEPGDDSIDIDVDESSQTSFPSLGNVDEMALVDLDDQGVVKDPTQVGADSKRTTGSRAAVNLADDTSVPAPGPGRVLRLDEVLAALATAPDAAQVSQLAIDCLRGQWKGGLILQIKDREKLALGEHGFGGSVTEGNVESIVVPLDQPSVLRTAHDDRRPFAGEAPLGTTVQDRFMKLFADVGSRTVAVAPVLVRARPVALLFGIGPRVTLPQASGALVTLANALGMAYLRIILASK